MTPQIIIGKNGFEEVPNTNIDKVKVQKDKAIKNVKKAKKKLKDRQIIAKFWNNHLKRIKRLTSE